MRSDATIAVHSTWTDPTMPAWSPWRVVRVVQVDLLGQVTVEPAEDPQGRFPGVTKAFTLREFRQHFVLGE